MSSDSAKGWSFATITDAARLDDIIEPWRAAAVRLGNAFMTPEWFLSFLEHAPGTSPFVVVIEEGGEPRGLLPLVHDRGALRFPGAEIGDFYQPLLIDSDNGAVVDRAVSALVDSASMWKVAVLDKVDPLVANRTRAALAGGSHRAVVGGWHSLPTIELGTLSWEEYLQSLSSNFRSEIRRKERALSRDHEVEFVEVRAGDQLESALQAHYLLHDKRWADHPRGRSPEWVRPFLSSFAARTADQGWLRLWRLTVDGDPAASWFGWNIGGRYSYYQAGLDVTRSRLSAGTLLLARTIRASIDEGCSIYDFLLGDESYKQRFTNDGRQVTTLVAAPRFAPHLLLVAGRWRLQFAMQRLPPEMKEALRSLLRRRT